MEINLSQFKDIKTIEFIQIDFTLYLLILTLCIILFSMVMFFLTRQKNIKITKKEILLEEFYNLDFNTTDTKSIIYNFTIYGKKTLRKDHKANFESILTKLEPYKYIKENKKLEDSLVYDMKNYIKSIKQCKL